MLVFKTIKEMQTNLDVRLEIFKSYAQFQQTDSDTNLNDLNILHIIVQNSGPVDELTTVTRIECILKERKDILTSLGIRLVNFLFPQPPKVMKISQICLLKRSKVPQDQLRPVIE